MCRKYGAGGSRGATPPLTFEALDAATGRAIYAAVLAETVALFERHKVQCGFGGVQALVE